MSPGARRFEFEIFAVSFAALLLEISYTRVISFKLFYYYTYLVIGFALLGIGSGGVLVAIVPRLTRAPLERLLAVGSLTAALVIALGYGVVASVPTNAVRLLAGSGAEVAKLLSVCLALFAGFLPIGVMIAALLGRTEHISRLYFADLIGAGTACAVVVGLLGLLTPPGCIALSAFLLAALAARLALPWSRPLLVASAAASALLALGVAFPRALPEPVTDATKTIRPETPRLFSAWNPVFRIDLTESFDVMHRVVHHDGLIGSTLHRFDGDVRSLERFRSDPRSWAFEVTERPVEKVLIVGAAGGHEILASLFYDAKEVTALELNSTTVSLLTEHFADYSGRLTEDPRVRLVNTEARSFLARDEGGYDLIFFVAPDSYSAMNAATSGAFVLSESYLYTVEMVEESLSHLSDGGLIAMQFGERDYDTKPNRTARYVSTARAALERMGVREPARHLLVATSPSFIALSTILVKREPFTDAEIARFVDNGKQIPGAAVRHAPGQRHDDGTVNVVVTLPSDLLPGWYARYPYDIAPVTDDAPFFWHFARFRNVLKAWSEPLVGFDTEDSIGERLLLVLIGIAALFAASFLLLPFVAIRETWSALPHKARSFGLFAAIGCGFMFFEVVLIQKLVLFLGYPTYSLTITLMSLLVSTGFGSLATARYGARRGRTVALLLGAIALLTLFYQYGLGALTGALLSAPLGVRAATALAIMAPLGFVLGAFMPLGLASLAASTPHREVYVAWGWAVNGFFSVIGSVLTTVLSMSYGFRAVLFLGLLAYVAAAALLHGLAAPTRGPTSAA